MTARRATWRPTMTAAVVAGLAFGALALSDLAAVAQLGILCGLGEVLTDMGLGQLAEHLPWFGQGVKAEEIEQFPPQLGLVYSIAFQLLNMVEENAAGVSSRKVVYVVTRCVSFFQRSTSSGSFTISICLW